MAFDVELSSGISEEESLSYIISYIKNEVLKASQNQRYILKVTDVVNKYLEKDRQKIRSQHQGMIQYRSDLFKNSEPFYCAVFNLCSRGILAPKPLTQQTQYNSYVETGVSFYLTDYGYAWVKNTHDLICLPSEYSKFSQLLKNHSVRLGNGYLLRSLEAVACYESHNYLACCAMCGASAESILLALAIAKKGSQDEILKTYKAASGRSNIEKFLIAQQKAHIQLDFTTFMSLLKYWRDESAHGTESKIQEEEAFTSLLLLLRFAQFADSKWQTLTT